MLRSSREQATDKGKLLQPHQNPPISPLLSTFNPFFYRAAIELDVDASIVSSDFNRGFEDSHEEEEKEEDNEGRDAQAGKKVSAKAHFVQKEYQLEFDDDNNGSYEIGGDDDDERF